MGHGASPPPPAGPPACQNDGSGRRAATLRTRGALGCPLRRTELFWPIVLGARFVPCSTAGPHATRLLSDFSSL